MVSLLERAYRSHRVEEKNMYEPTQRGHAIPQGRLSAKRALITGAASGIGRATALLFAEEGSRVVLWDVNEEGLNAVVEEVSATSEDILSATANVADESEVADAVDAIDTAWGGLDVVVANAAVSFPADVPVHELDIEVWNRVIDVNLTGTFLTCKYGVRSMMKHGDGGSIVCVSSGAAFKAAAPTKHAYSASKGGIYSLSRVMARDYAEVGIRVNSVIPGFTDTPFVKRAMARDETKARILSRVPMGRPGGSEEVASMIAYLASDDASYSTGGAFFVDGGADAN